MGHHIKLLGRATCAIFVALIGGAMAAGCGYSHATDPFMGPYTKGEFAQSAAKATEIADDAAKNNSASQVLFRLEQGTALRAAGQFDASDQAFNTADDIMEKFDNDPKFSISRESTAAVTNLASLDYRGTSYDGVMLNTYKALNYLEQGNTDRARVEINRIALRQNMALDRYAKEIEKDKELRGQKAADKKASTKESKESKGTSYNVDGARKDAKFQQSLSSQLGDQYAPDDYAPITKGDLTALNRYANPFAEYVRGIYFLSAGDGGSDDERALTAFKRVAGMLDPQSSALPFAMADAQMADDCAQGKKLPPTTYVFFETGIGPERESIRIDVPIFILNIAWRDTGVDYVGASFPKLKFTPGAIEHLYVRTASGQSYRTALLADMDAIIKQQFKNELPMVITKTLIATATKAAIAYGANKATEQNAYANILTRVSTTVYQAAMNQADLRTWRTLPKQVQVARFDTPADGRLSLALPNGMSLPTVQLNPGRVNIVLVKNVSPTAPTVVRQIALGTPVAGPPGVAVGAAAAKAPSTRPASVAPAAVVQPVAVQPAAKTVASPPATQPAAAGASKNAAAAVEPRSAPTTAPANAVVDTGATTKPSK